MGKKENLETQLLEVRQQKHNLYIKDYLKKW